MTRAGYQYLDFYNLVDGLNTVSSAIRLKPSEARDIQNVELFPIGGISQRNGYSLLIGSEFLDVETPFGTLHIQISGVTAGPAEGLYGARYSLAGGTNLTYFVSASKLYKKNADLDATGWTDITNGLTITSGANNIWNFAILNDICVLGNGVDSPIQIDSAGTATALTAGVPFTSFVFPVECRGYMWYFVPTVGGIKQYDRGYFSDINNPAVVGTNNYVDVAKGQGGISVAAVDYKTYLYVFKRHGIYQLTFQPTRVNSSGTLFPWTESPNPVVPGVGTQSPRSIVKFTTPSTHATPGQELVFFVDQFGCPRIFDGMTTLSFNSKIGSSRDTAILSLSDMDKTRTPYAFAINYPAKNQIFCFLSRLNSQQDTCWVLDYSTGFAFTRYKYALPFNVGALLEQSSGDFKPYVGDYNGGTYELDSGTSDYGQPIDAYYVTGDSFLKSPVINNKWFFTEVRGSTGDVTQSVNIDYFTNGLDTSEKTDALVLANQQTEWGAGPPAMTWGTSSWAKRGLVTKSNEINLVSKTIRTKFSNSELDETFVIEGWTMAGELLGTSQD